MERAALSDILREVRCAPELHDRLARAVYNLGGGRVPFVFAAGGASNLINAVETAVITTPPLNPPSDTAVVLAIGFYQMGAAGATTAGLATIIRRGADVTGVTLVPNGSVIVTAGNPYFASCMVMDTPGAVAGVQYTMTGRAISATANSTIVTSLLVALALG